MTCNLGRFVFISFTRVDLPVAIPPVSPKILTFFNFLPIKKMNIQGRKVLKSGLILTKKYLAKQNYLNKLFTLTMKGIRKTTMSGFVCCLSLNL